MKSDFEIIFIKQPVEFYHIILIFLGVDKSTAWTNKQRYCCKKGKKDCNKQQQLFRNALGKESQQDWFKGMVYMQF